MEKLEDSEQPILHADVSSPEPGVVVVALAGELDLSNIEQLEAEVAPALETGVTRLVIKAEALEFADSSAIALWLRWAATVEQFELHDLSPLLRRVLSAMGLQERLVLRP
jgi:anti-anti-sigma factor